MPYGDRTGPQGAGPMSGRGMGFCAGYHYPGSENQGWGLGAGRGRNYGAGYGRGGGGFGHRHGFRATGIPGRARYLEYPPAESGPYSPTFAEAPQMYPKDEQKYLKSQIKHLEDHLAELSKRLKDLAEGEEE